MPLPSRTHFVLYPFCWRKTIKEKLPNKEADEKKQDLSIDISDDGDHGTSQRRERQSQSSWYLRCACSFFSACCKSSSKWAMANAMPRPSGLGLGFSSGCLAICLPSSDSPSKRSCCMAIDLPSMILGRMILWSFEALAQTGFFAWYTNDWFMPDRFHTGSYRFGARFVFFSSLSQLANSVWQFVETDFLKLLMDSFVCRLTTLQFWTKLYGFSAQNNDKSAKTALTRHKFQVHSVHTSADTAHPDALSLRAWEQTTGEWFEAGLVEGSSKQEGCANNLIFNYCTLKWCLIRMKLCNKSSGCPFKKMQLLRPSTATKSAIGGIESLKRFNLWNCLIQTEITWKWIKNMFILTDQNQDDSAWSFISMEMNGQPCLVLHFPATNCLKQKSKKD